ncbi:ABC transporter ATP-binding protein/permease [Desulfovibrio sp. OttesenSCG-928-O18]|nr:ABC transporter ATP-binding protein/permease [Desulfovibrio sp. OttesenSCG-928-O18]
MILGNLFVQVQSALRHQPQAMRKRLWLLAVFTVIVGVLEIGVAGLVSLFGVAIASPQSVLNLRAVKIVLELFPQLHFLQENPVWLLVVLLVCIVLGVGVKDTLLGLLTYKQSHYAAEITAYFSSRVFRSYILQNYVWHLKENSAGLLAMVPNRNQMSFFFSALLLFVSQSFIALGLLFVGFILAPMPMLIVLGVTGATAIVTYKFSRRRIRRNNERMAANTVVLNKNIMAGLQGIMEVQVYQREEMIVQNVDETLHAVTDDNAMNATLPLLPVLTLETMGMVTLLLALLFMIAHDYTVAQLTGALALLAAMAWRLLPTMNKMVAAIVRMQGTLPYVENFFEALGAIPDEDIQSTDPSPIVFSREIVFNAVSFRYPGAQDNALKQISLRIPRGKMIGVVGPSGSGKSTLIGVLTGLLFPDEGSISVDDTGLSGRECSRLRGLVGYVPQSPYLVDASLAENVAFSRFGEPVDEAAVLKACKMAALDFWESLPEGIHTCIGDRGVRLSGGQAQRVAIARALYAQPELLVFDEATSALDGATERAIQKTIEELGNTLTVVMVAHRLDTVKSCDTVYHIAGGRVIDSGEPDDVLGRYESGQAAMRLT